LELALHLEDTENIHSLLSDFTAEFNNAIRASASLSALEQPIRMRLAKRKPMRGGF
jgi:hypothetical protein